ncbi:MAG: glycosyltransferase [Aphanocapsa sp. GSE-SYN-MK-11-07L]|jgi:glycosyltransferase involved in cell wall biosynthesis|nr:glycosyltransferase [Aphanocapsa sp. GSE-SYN-MK-11-07L]
MKISIITVCRNAKHLLEKTIQSVSAQTYPDIEYLMIDGASTDGTPDLALQYQDYIHTFISEPDGGIYEAMNKGIHRASGDFIYFMNADDFLIHENVIQQVVDFLNQHPECDFSYGNLQVRHRHGEPTIHCPPEPAKILDEMLAGCLPHQASFTRQQVFSTVGAFNPRYRIAADYDWFLRLILVESLKIYSMPITVASYNAVGASTNWQNLLPEKFEIQNQFPPYQRQAWLLKRIETYQQEIIKLRSRDLELSRLVGSDSTLNTAVLLEQLQEAHDTIEAMKTSKFWQLRSAWLRLKNKLKKV